MLWRVSWALAQISCCIYLCVFMLLHFFANEHVHTIAAMQRMWALIFWSRVTYCWQVSQFASVLESRGVVKGDRVLIYMPMVPQAIVAMLASARIGAIHSLVFGGFASKELAARINHAQVLHASLPPELELGIKRPHLSTVCQVWTWNS